MTPEQFARLPKFAQEEIETLRRQRQQAVAALNNFVDQDTPSNVWFDERPCTGESPGPTYKKHYVQSRWLEVEWAGVRLTVLLRGGSHGDHEVIDLAWQDEKRTHGEVTMQPRSYQNVYLFK